MGERCSIAVEKNGFSSDFGKQCVYMCFTRDWAVGSDKQELTLLSISGHVIYGCRIVYISEWNFLQCVPWRWSVGCLPELAWGLGWWLVGFIFVVLPACQPKPSRVFAGVMAYSDTVTVRMVSSAYKWIWELTAARSMLFILILKPHYVLFLP